VIDENGRVLGRVNVVDLAVAVTALVVAPLLAYTSWRVERTPPPEILSVAAPAVSAQQDGTEIHVTGRHLRPFVRANIGNRRVPFVYESAERGRVRVPPLRAGEYDVAFFESKEIARFPNALVVKPGAMLELRVRFIARPEIADAVLRIPRDAGAPESRPQMMSLERVHEAVTARDRGGDPGPFTVLMGLVRVRATWTRQGWSADGVLLRAGGPFTMTAPSYVLDGQILGIDTSHAAQ